MRGNRTRRKLNALPLEKVLQAASAQDSWKWAARLEFSATGPSRAVKLLTGCNLRLGASAAGAC